MRHEFVPISKRDYKSMDLLNDTIRIENITNSLNSNHSVYLLDKYSHTKIGIRHQKFTGWYHKHGVAGQFREPVKILTRLMGFPPTTYHAFTHRTAVWAFYWNEEPILLFKSVRGVTLQVLESFPISKLRPFYSDLLERLECQGTLYNRRKKEV